MKIFTNPTITNIFIISSIAFHFLLCFSEDAVDLFKACEVSYNCGSLVNVSYPFWGNQRPNLCGPTKFELKCNDNRTTTIQINSLEYYVLDINQSNQIMRIARSDLFDNLYPNFKNQNETATLYEDDSGFWPTDNDRNITIWYDCPPQEGIPEDFRFWCSWEGEKIGRGNYALEPEAMYLSRNLGGCKLKIKATVTVKSLEEGQKNRTTLLATALRQGFEAQYFTDVPCEYCKESGGACGGNATQDYYCICGNGNVHFLSCLASPTSTPAASVGIAIGSIHLIIFIIILSILLVIRSRKKRKSSSNKDEIEETIKRYSTQIPKRYTYSELKKITDSFQKKLGQGGFSIVYKGKLLDGRYVAVKLLNESRETIGQDFINEVVSITRTSHVNIVTFLGFCYEENKRALIYEYMPKGSLDNYIFHKGLQKDQVELNWNTLYSILVGVARGLEYLHRGCNTRILHFDIKPHNILLNNEFCPKISDFGLAKQCKARESHVSMTCAKGTIGFMAPEVIIRSFGKVSHKSDVYSYGMLVLEMVGERKCPNKGKGQGQGQGQSSSSEEYFPDWIYKDLAGGTGSEIDRNCRQWGKTEEEEEMVRKMVVVSLYCIQTLPDDRPSMTEVVAMLEGNVDGLQIPPKPTFFESPAAELPQAAAAAASFSSSTSYL